MIIKLNQTRSDITFKYEILHSDSLLFNSSIPIKLMGQVINFEQNNKIIYKIKSSSITDTKQLFNLNFSIYKSYFIKDIEDNIVGYILIKSSSFWFGYYYYEIMLNNENYTVYEIGRGKEGLFLPIYKNEEQCAVINKDIIVYDNKDTYKVYIKEEKDLMPVLLFNVLYDSIRWANTGEYAYKKKTYNYIYTTNKVLKSKYNPKFIEDILE